MRLTVFLTAGLSFAHWKEMGILDRELALYRVFRSHGIETAFVSYGSGAAAENGGRLLCCDTKDFSYLLSPEERAVPPSCTANPIGSGITPGSRRRDRLRLP